MLVALLLGEPQVQGAHDAEAVTATLEGAADRLRGCHAEALTRNADLSGRLVYALTVDASGSPTAVELGRSTLRDHDQNTQQEHHQNNRRKPELLPLTHKTPKVL